METMYSAKVDSPITTLTSKIEQSDTTIPVKNADYLPDAPNIATIFDNDDTETIKYEGKNENELTDVTRGFQGDEKTWEKGTEIARFYTDYDHNSFKNNIEKIFNKKYKNIWVQSDEPSDDANDGDLWIDTN